MKFLCALHIDIQKHYTTRPQNFFERPSRRAVSVQVNAEMFGEEVPLYQSVKLLIGHKMILSAVSLAESFLPGSVRN